MLKPETQEKIGQARKAHDLLQGSRAAIIAANEKLGSGEFYDCRRSLSNLVSRLDDTVLELRDAMKDVLFDEVVLANPNDPSPF